MQKIISILAIAMLSIVFNKVSAQSNADSTKTLHIKVTGIGCDGDMVVIKKKLVNQEGIDEVTFTDKKNGASNFKIIYHTAYITEAKIKELIEAAPCCDNPDEFPYKVKPIVSKPKKK